MQYEAPGNGQLSYQKENNSITIKLNSMKNYNQVEVILFARYYLKNADQKELVRWLGTTAQSAIGRQQERVKKLFVRTLKNTPPIYLS